MSAVSPSSTLTRNGKATVPQVHFETLNNCQLFKMNFIFDKEIASTGTLVPFHNQPLHFQGTKAPSPAFTKAPSSAFFCLTIWKQLQSVHKEKVFVNWQILVC